MDIDLRIDKYDFHYQFRNNPTDFDWSCHPERIIIRNESLRTADRAFYERYLMARYPERAEQELSAFDRDITMLVRLTGAEAATLFKEHDVTLVRSDIHWEESDAIFTARALPDLDLSFLVSEEDDEQLILNHVYPEWITDRPLLWIDKSELYK